MTDRTPDQIAADDATDEQIDQGVRDLWKCDVITIVTQAEPFGDLDDPLKVIGVCVVEPA